VNKGIWISTLFALLGFAGGISASQEAEKEESKEVLVDINHATVEELVELPGVGEQVAKRIVAYREKNGPFESAEELMNVRGIGEKSFLKLERFITLGGEKEKRKE
jgi:competence protein ComEA